MEAEPIAEGWRKVAKFVIKGNKGRMCYFYDHCDCPAKMKIVLNDKMTWVLAKFIEGHNHLLSATS